jgi:hypothetical protein
MNTRDGGHEMGFVAEPITPHIDDNDIDSQGRLA